MRFPRSGKIWTSFRLPDGSPSKPNVHDKGSALNLNPSRCFLRYSNWAISNCSAPRRFSDFSPESVNCDRTRGKVTLKKPGIAVFARSSSFQSSRQFRLNVIRSSVPSVSAMSAGPNSAHWRQFETSVRLLSSLMDRFNNSNVDPPPGAAIDCEGTADR